MRTGMLLLAPPLAIMPVPPTAAATAAAAFAASTARPMAALLRLWELPIEPLCGPETPVISLRRHEFIRELEVAPQIGAVVAVAAAAVVAALAAKRDAAQCTDSEDEDEDEDG